jgi:hypothetical protein
VLVNAGGLWNRVFQAVAIEFPDVTTDYLHVDAATIALCTNPDRFDVIVTDNLFGDILTDEAAAITGGIGLAASANINVDGSYPSMFEPVHGSAPDIAGQGIADPRAAILSVAMMLEHLGRTDEAAAIQTAVEADIVATGAAKRRRPRSATPSWRRWGDHPAAPLFAGRRGGAEAPSAYDRMGGHDTFVRLVAAFYRGVASDEPLRALYPEEDLGPAEERLRMFLEQYFGGPNTYSETRGHPRLRMRHAPFAVTPTSATAG